MRSISSKPKLSPEMRTLRSAIFGSMRMAVRSCSSCGRDGRDDVSERKAPEDGRFCDLLVSWFAYSQGPINRSPVSAVSAPLHPKLLEDVPHDQRGGQQKRHAAPEARCAAD